MKENRFNFYVDIDQDEFEKAAKVQHEGKYDNMILAGVASDESKDYDDEEIDPKGIDTRRFLHEGLINYEHMAKTGGSKFIIGEPVDAFVKDGKFFVKGKLWKGKKIAEDLWDTLLVMKENNSKRRIGWSIEGKALERDRDNPKKIKKALLTHIALTFMPKNYNTFADIVKGHQEEDFIEPENDIKDNKYVYEFTKGCKKYGVTKSFEIEEREEDEEEKATTTSSTECLRKESLDKRTKNIIKSILNNKISTKEGIKLIKHFKI